MSEILVFADPRKGEPVAEALDRSVTKMGMDIFRSDVSIVCRLGEFSDDKRWPVIIKLEVVKIEKHTVPTSL